jgi:hypothetical protein
MLVGGFAQMLLAMARDWSWSKRVPQRARGRPAVREAISTGTACCYDPVVPVDWEL